MPAPFPPESNPGGVVYARRAEQVYRLYVDIARIAEAITNVEPDIDLEKLAHLAFSLSLDLQTATSPAPAEFRAAVRQRMEAGGLEWPTQNDMVTDIAAIRDECLLLRTWVIANLPAALTPATKTFNTSDSTFSIVATKLAKPHPVEAEVAKVRALFV